MAEIFYYQSAGRILVSDMGDRWPDHFGWLAGPLGLHFQAIWKPDPLLADPVSIFDHWRVKVITRREFEERQRNAVFDFQASEIITREKFDKLLCEYLVPDEVSE